MFKLKCQTSRRGTPTKVNGWCNNQKGRLKGNETKMFLAELCSEEMRQTATQNEI